MSRRSSTSSNGSQGTSPWLLTRSVRESEVARNQYRERSPAPRQESSRYRGFELDSQGRDLMGRRYEPFDYYQTPPGYQSRRRDLPTRDYTDRYEDDPYRSRSSYRDNRYDSTDSYVGTSRDPYRDTGRDRYGSLTVDSRLTALPGRRYESSLTYQGESSRRDSRDTYRSTPADSSRYEDLVRYGESAGGTPSRYARYAEVERRGAGGGERSGGGSRYGYESSTYPYDSYGRYRR